MGKNRTERENRPHPLTLHSAKITSEREHRQAELYGQTEEEISIEHYPSPERDRYITKGGLFYEEY